MQTNFVWRIKFSFTKNAIFNNFFNIIIPKFPLEMYFLDQNATNATGSVKQTSMTFSSNSPKWRKSSVRQSKGTK